MPEHRCSIVGLERSSAGTSLMKATIAPLTSLRFVAALVIVIYHMRDYSLVGWRGGVIERGALAVDFFFILSGFILAHAHGAAFAAGRGSLRSFLLARIARLYPVHAVVLTLFVAYVGLLGAMGFSYNAVRYTPGALLAHVLLLPAWNISPDMTWNYPDWSIGAEFAAYLCFPALAFVLLRGSGRVAAVWFTVVAGVFLCANPVLHLTSRTLDFSVLRILPEFVLGLLAYRLHDRLQARVAGVLFVGTAGVLAVAVLAGLPDAVVVLLFVPLILAASHLSGRIGRALSAPALVRLGEASYSLYMVHALVLSMVYSAMKVPALGKHVPMFAADLACPLVAILGSLVLHAVVEVPGRRLLLGLFDRRRSARVREAIAVP